MIKELQKKSLKSVLVSVVILLVIGIFMAVPFVENIEYHMKDDTIFENLAPSDIQPDMFVNISLMDNFGCFMEEYTENTKTHVQTTDYLYYVIWTGDDEAVDFRYMAIKVPVDYMDAMEVMAENTYNYTRGKTLPFSGYVKEFDDEEYSFFEEYFVESGWTDEEIQSGTLPYYIDIVEESDGTFNIVFLVGAILLWFWAVYRLVKACTGGFLKKFRKDIADAGYTEASLESDYAAAKNSNFNSGILIGMGVRMIYFMDGAHPRAASTKKILWAYQNTTQHRTYGIPTGKSYSACVWIEGRNTSINITAKNEEAAQEILRTLGIRYPWMVLGYSPELAAMYNKNLPAFKDLKYNKEIANVLF